MSFHEFIAPEDLLISDVRRATPRIVENFRNCAGAIFQPARNVQASKERSLRGDGSGPANFRRRMPEVARRVLHRVAQLEVTRQPNYFWVARRLREMQSPRRKLQRPPRACCVGAIYERIWAEMDSCFPGVWGVLLQGRDAAEGRLELLLVLVRVEQSSLSNLPRHVYGHHVVRSLQDLPERRLHSRWNRRHAFGDS